MTEGPSVSLSERLKAPPAPEMVRAYFASKVPRELEYCFDAEMQIHLAHGLMLAQRGIVRPADMRRILAVVLELWDAGSEGLKVDYTLEDLYSYTERHLIRRLGPEVGGRLHTARSRNDLHTTAWRMALREKLASVLGHLVTLRATALSLAAAHAETVMPGYTHSQHAQPITLGYYFLTLADLLGRDSVRLRAALHQVDRCPLGAGALTSTGFPIDRESTARALGFPTLVEVAYDAVACRDDVHETAAALAILMVNLSRLAVDLQNWNTPEYGFVELADEYSVVSSIMPQKKNPQSLEHTKGAAGVVCGVLTTVLACTKNTSLSDVNDGVSAINVPVLEATESTGLALKLLDGVVRTLTMHPEVMRRAAVEGFGTATELADVIVRETGLSFRMAHSIVGRVVSEALAAGKPAGAITAPDLDAASRTLFARALDIAPEAVQQALDPSLNVRLRTIVGGPAPTTVRAAVDRRREQVDADRGDLASVAERLSQARGRLVEEARTFIAAS